LARSALVPVAALALAAIAFGPRFFPPVRLAAIFLAALPFARILLSHHVTSVVATAL
jgi:hypothetical protein